ncbi:MAG: restriction endonuclease [Bacteroidia bacterium]|nr:restriction endonuclease [Bacteroidia bacterium]
MAMEDSGNEIKKPIKPTISSVALIDEEVDELNKFKVDCEKKSKRVLIVCFFILSIIGILITLQNKIDLSFIILTTVASAIISWGILPVIVKLIFKQDLKSVIFEKTQSDMIAYIQRNYTEYEEALAEYKIKNELYERVLRRATWNYWLSLSATEFEIAVGQLFHDKGYDVYTTPATGDKGVDLYLKKGDKTAVVQCKNYKKTLGPNAARDLYGTMFSEKADEAFLAAPGGFSRATIEFCEDKPITLLDIDELTKMSYVYENYTARWIDTAQSLDDIKKGMKKHLGMSTRKKRY